MIVQSFRLGGDFGGKSLALFAEHESPVPDFDDFDAPLGGQFVQSGFANAE